MAILSVCALALAVVVSCISRLNVGVLAVALAWIVGVYVGGMPVATIMNGFPSQLFLTLTGVTLLFALAESNGTLERITHHAVRLCRGNRGTIPVMFFVLGAALSSMGPGNIATAALLAPLAMATAARTGIPLFLMAIMVGNGANSGALSPFAPTGIIVNGIMTRNGLPGLELQTYLYNLLAHALVAFAGYALFGGLKLFTSGRTPATAVPGAEPIGEPAVSGRTPIDGFDRRHWITLVTIATLVVSVIVAKVNVGMAAFAGAVVLVLSKSADDGEAIKRMPWRVIVMVCGVTVLISLVERAQGIELLVSLVARIGVGEHRDRRRRVLHGDRLCLQQHLGRRSSGVPADGARARRRAARRQPHRDCDVDERRRAPRRRLAALHDRRVVPGRCQRRRQPRTLQQAAGVGAVDGGRRRAVVLRAVLKRARASPAHPVNVSLRPSSPPCWLFSDRRGAPARTSGCP